MKKIIIVLLLIMYSRPLYPQNVYLNSSVIHKGTHHCLLLEIINSSRNNIYIPITHWEINGIKDTGGVLLGFPNLSYLVNVIHYAPSSFKGRGIPAIGDKGNFPDYHKLPQFIRINPHKTYCLELRLPDSMLEWAKDGKMLINSGLSYCSEEQWIMMKQNIDKSIDKAIISAPIFKSIGLQSEGKVIELKTSAVKVDVNKSKFIRSLFTQKIASECLIH